MSIVNPYGFSRLKLKSLLAVIGGCILWGLSVSSWSIGLGKIQLESHLNEPLRATIPIEDSAGLRSSEARVTLASEAEYNDLGVAWSYSLEALVLRIVSEQTSLPAVNSELVGLRLELTSTSAIAESNLNLVIQFDWPNGQLVRDYTLRLASPLSTIPADSQGPVIESELAPTRDNEFGTQIHGLGKSNFGLSSLLIQSGDTLWEIALANRGDRSVSVQEMMIAIQFVNPEVFIDQNINLLKAGYRLEMPNERDFDNFNAGEAFAKVEDQNRALNIGIKEKTLEPLSSENDTDLDGELVLAVKPAHRATEVFEEPATGIKLLSGQRMLTRDAPVNKVLEERMAVLDAQLANMTNAISAKDQQIVTLQQQLRALPEAPEPDNESALIHPVTLSLVAGLIVLVVVILLMSARHQRLTRAARATPIAHQDELTSVLSGDAKTAASYFADEQEQQKSNPSASTLSEHQDRFELDEMESLEIDMVDLDEAGNTEEMIVGSPESPVFSESMTVSSDDKSLLNEDEDPASMLDLARAYIDMGEPTLARDLLARVQMIGVASEIEEAEKMLAGLSSK